MFFSKRTLFLRKAIFVKFVLEYMRPCIHLHSRGWQWVTYRWHIVVAGTLHGDSLHGCQYRDEQPECNCSPCRDGWSSLVEAGRLCPLYLGHDGGFGAPHWGRERSNRPTTTRTCESGGSGIVFFLRRARCARRPLWSWCPGLRGCNVSFRLKEVKESKSQRVKGKFTGCNCCNCASSVHQWKALCAFCVCAYLRILYICILICKLTHTYPNLRILAHMWSLFWCICAPALSAFLAELEMYISQRAGWSSNEADFKARLNRFQKFTRLHGPKTLVNHQSIRKHGGHGVAPWWRSLISRLRCSAIQIIQLPPRCTWWQPRCTEAFCGSILFHGRGRVLCRRWRHVMQIKPMQQQHWRPWMKHTLDEG